MKKRVLVTGSSKGIGKAVALRLARDGFDVTVHGRNDLAGAQQTVAEIQALGANSYYLLCDVANRQQCREVFEADIEKNGAYYGIVCNAGVTRDTAFPAMTGEEWDTVIHTNLDGLYNVLHPLVLPMVSKRQGGRIVTMASVSGVIGNRGQVNYSASKGGVIAATKALSLELAKRKITVNCVAPGLIDTGMTDELPIDEIVKMIPLKRVGQVHEVAGTVAFLMSDDAAYITRQVISVNGGMA
ncbi:3-ketoacyl-ACP reductase FabG2 [Paraglaciecola hydrolytica]|uniref:Beta-ketoacyl-ACP reductase n=1 Tax=Paraglaciecola hydrolytica TaxID=1799789 RepID=A0A136A248_9ALTE|nr:3-ketoacyl-ACP reductase FabG2 [Paraglaciecola hydrolytica]KXI29319.1 beta-ketoacyl-ACP reductase [Paraglaciecola hydrolytica]